jgi:hypothetical protein
VLNGFFLSQSDTKEFHKGHKGILKNLRIENPPKYAINWFQNNPIFTFSKKDGKSAGKVK